jgi:hypothetical protein
MGRLSVIETVKSMEKPTGVMDRMNSPQVKLSSASVFGIRQPVGIACSAAKSYTPSSTIRR